MNALTFSDKVERAVDSDPDVSPRESLTRIFLRPWLFALCVLVPPLLAVGVTSLVPTTYKATVKILIRYGESEAAFLRDLIPENRAALSGLSSAEILRSLPAVIATVQQQHITESDIAKSPKDILMGLVSKHLPSADESAPATPPQVAGVDAATLRLAESFQGSLADSTSGASAKPVQLLEKGLGNLPTAQRGDDLITMTVPSFNRDKVAGMANGLAQAFIGEYARLSAEEAHRSVVFLDQLLADAQTGAVPLSPAGRRAASAGGAANDAYRQSPILESIAKELAVREADLAALSAIHLPNSPVIVNARAAVNALRASLSVSEREEVQKLAIDQLRLRRYQAANTEQLFRSGLVPISIVEPAVTPKRSSSTSRLLVSGGVGLALGLMLALSLVVVLSVTDQRLHTSWDAERAIKAPLMATLPVLKRQGGHAIWSRHDDPALDEALLQLIGRLDLFRRGERGMALAVTSAADGDGKTFVLSSLAAALARGGRHKVLVVDTDLRGRSLSIASGCNEMTGLIDAMLDGTPLAERVRPTALPGVQLMPAGTAKLRSELGFYRHAFEKALLDARRGYDFVLVDTTAVLGGIDPLLCGSGVDGVLWVARSGVSRKAPLRAALAKLAELGLRPIGFVLNGKRQLLPNFLWRNV